MTNYFRDFSQTFSNLSGKPIAFATAVSIVLVWIILGPVFNYSNTWQLSINTTTTIVTFLMVFLIQHTQSRETKATQLKLDELIRSIKGARNQFVELQDEDDLTLDQLEKQFEKFKEKHKADSSNAKPR